MKSNHVAAPVCFGIAILLAVFTSSAAGAGGFAFLGFIFEAMGWKKLSDSDGDKE
jgi:Na+/phosphate symporter